MLCQGRSNFEGLTHVATREVISRYVNYTRQVRGGGVDVKMCNKNDKERSRCITNLSLLEPFFNGNDEVSIVALKLMWCLAKRGPQTMHVNIISMSSLAIIPTSYHSGGHCHCNH